MPGSQALLRPANEMAPVIEIETANAAPGSEAGPDLQVPDAEAESRDPRVLSTSIVMYLVQAVVAVVVVKARPREIGVEAETEIGTETRIGILAALVMKTSRGDVVDREVAVAGGTGIGTGTGRGLGREVEARM